MPVRRIRSNARKPFIPPSSSFYGWRQSAKPPPVCTTDRCPDTRLFSAFFQIVKDQVQISYTSLQVPV